MTEWFDVGVADELPERSRRLVRSGGLPKSPVDVISERGLPAQTELVGILHQLAERPGEKKTHP